MIVSHKHKYVFIQSPRTGCTALGKELIEQYDGEPIVYMHAAYHDYLRHATPEMRRYFVFSSIRNPVDEIQSFYYKFVTNHGGDFTNPDKLSENGGWVTPRMMKAYHYIKDNNADFVSFLEYFYKTPYVNWSILDHSNFDYVIRYENLQDDFAEVLKKIGIEQERPLPLVNKTKKDQVDLTAILSTEQIDKVNRALGPMAEYLGYSSITGDCYTLSFTTKLAFEIMCVIKTFYWRYVRRFFDKAMYSFDET